MPKATFHNLSDEKRERFIGAALDEFALHDYRSASVSRIVETLGIAKGSLYQYFEGKQELYAYLVASAAAEKFAFIDASVGDEASGFFERFTSTVFHGARFDFTEPRLASILYNVTYEPGAETLSISARLKAASLEYLDGLVRSGIRSGDLRGDIDVGYVAFALYQLSASLRDYLSERFGFSFKAAVQAGSGSPIRDEDLHEVLRELVALLRGGLADTSSSTSRPTTSPV